MTQETPEQTIKRIFDSPCEFRLAMSSSRASRREIIERLKAVISEVEIGTRGYVSGGNVWIDMRCDNP